MTSAFTLHQVEALAPDDASLRQARTLGEAPRWSDLGRRGPALWGTIKGSRATPYQVHVDLDEPAYECTCPSRKLPCKHALGLLLLHARTPEDIPEAAPPPRMVSFGEAGARQRRGDAEPPPPEEGIDDPVRAARRRRAADKRAAAREARISEGIGHLCNRLDDLVRQGLTRPQLKDPDTWRQIAARLVDAQAPGLARMVHAISELPIEDPQWHERLLEHLARIHLLISAYARRASLEPDQLADVREGIGFNVSRAELLEQDGVEDRWWVMANATESAEDLIARRTWLWGERTERIALLIDYAPRRRPPALGFEVGAGIDAEVVYYPGAQPLRALVKTHRGPATQDPFAAPAAFESIEAAHRRFGQASARNPWIQRWPVGLRDVHVACDDDAGCVVHEPMGHELPLATANAATGWRLMALAAGRPISLFGELDGDQLRPLSCVAGGALRSLS